MRIQRWDKCAEEEEEEGGENNLSCFLSLSDWLSAASLLNLLEEMTGATHPASKRGKTLEVQKSWKTSRQNTVAKFQSSEIYDKTSINPVKKNTACPLAGGP